MEAMTETAAARVSDSASDKAMVSDLDVTDRERGSISAVERLVSCAKYAPPKVVSFPIDAMRLTEPISLAGNT